MGLKEAGLRGSVRNVSSVGAIPDSGLLRYEYEDDSDTATAIDSWNNNDGAISGATYTTTAEQGTLALDFDRTDDYINTGVTAQTDASYSLATYIRPSAVEADADQMIIGASPDGDLRELAYYSLGDQIGMAVRNDSGTFYDAGEAVSNLSNGTYYHVIGVYDSTVPEIRYYRDGTLINSTAVSGTFANGDGSNWFVGARNGSSNFFGGIKDLTDIYNKALSDTEATNLASTGSINA